jgi:hypothetical protein
MARNYKRDSIGRFSGTGGGGKVGKSAKNESARTKYKQASSKLRSAEKAFGGNSPAAGTQFGKRAIAGAKSGLTRVTKNLRGGAAGNIGSQASAKASTKKAVKAPAKRAAPQKTASSMNSQVAAGRAAKAAYKSKSASKRKAAVARKGGSFTQTSTFKNSLKGKQAKARQAKKAAKS